MHDVFISYSSKDRVTAAAACHALEQAGIRCWIAPRDVTAGASYPLKIIEAIGECPVMVLVFSSNANLSRHVIREVGIALESGTVVIPYRIEPVAPLEDLSYLLHGLHWLDAHPDREEFSPLVEHVRRNLGPHDSPASGEGALQGRQPPTLPGKDLHGPAGAAHGPGRPATTAQGQTLGPGSHLIGMVFSGVSFAGVNGKGATLSKSVFRGCDFTGARLDSSILSGANLEAACLDGASIRDARMDFVNLLGASCIEADFEYARMTRADLRRTNLTRASLHLIDGSEANFEDAIAVGARFSSALLTGADMSSADLTNADFTGAVMDGCRLAGANLSGARGLTADQLRVAITDRFTVLDPPTA